MHPASGPDNPVWFMVDIRLTRIFPTPVTREVPLDESDRTQMLPLKKGSRLSIQPVTATELQAVRRIAGTPIH